MRRLATLAVAIALGAGCALATNDSSSEQDLQPIDRLLVGQAAKYPADTTLRAKIDTFDSDRAQRRAMAWKIVAKILAPTPIVAKPGGRTASLPRFQTWYSKEDILPMFDHLIRALPTDKLKAHAPFPEGAVDAIFPWNATSATSLASFTEEREKQRLTELKTQLGLHSVGQDTRALMSPEYVAHVLRSYPQVVGCKAPAADKELESTPNFTTCLESEFPVNAAAVKTRWVRGGQTMPVYDTSPAAVAAKLGAGKWGDGDAQANPGTSAIYTMQLTADTTMRLAGLHIMTKELRDWAWITLWWSDSPDTDFGADRPPEIAALGGPWKNYKMCVATAYDEKDPAAIAELGANGPATFCSNPYLEINEHAARTNCIGCHQNGGTGETSETVLAAPDKFPDGSRKKIRKNFPADYAYTTSTGIELAAEMKNRIDALAP